MLIYNKGNDTLVILGKVGTQYQIKIWDIATNNITKTVQLNTTDTKAITWIS